MSEGDIWREDATPASIGAGAVLYRLSPNATDLRARRSGARPGALLVDDDAKRLGPGQLRKSVFLAELETAVCAAAERAFEGVRWTPEGCPWVARWFAYYHGRSAAHVEKALRRYAPEVTDATSARDYIPAVTARIRAGIVAWKTTGKVSGVPDESGVGDDAADASMDEVAGVSDPGFAGDLRGVSLGGEERRSYAARGGASAPAIVGRTGGKREWRWPGAPSLRACGGRRAGA